MLNLATLILIAFGVGRILIMHDYWIGGGAVALGVSSFIVRYVRSKQDGHAQGS